MKNEARNFAVLPFSRNQIRRRKSFRRALWRLFGQLPHECIPTNLVAKTLFPFAQIHYASSCAYVSSQMASEDLHFCLPLFCFLYFSFFFLFLLHSKLPVGTNLLLLLLLLLLLPVQFVERLISLDFVVSAAVNSRQQPMQRAGCSSCQVPVGRAFTPSTLVAARTFCLSHLCHKQDAAGGAGGAGGCVCGWCGCDSQSVTEKCSTQKQRSAQENAMKVVLSERKTETEISSSSSSNKKMCQGH